MAAPRYFASGTREDAGRQGYVRDDRVPDWGDYLFV